MGKITGLPNVSSLRKQIEGKINNAVSTIQNDPTMDGDKAMDAFYREVGIDKKHKEYMEKGMKACEIVGQVKDAVVNPKGFAVDLVTRKATEMLADRPEIQALKNKVMDYAKSKVEVMPQYKAVKKEVESAIETAKSDPEQLMKEMEDPEKMVKDRYHRIFG